MGSRGISAIQNVSYDFSRDSLDATKERVGVKRGKSQLPSRSMGHTDVKVIPKKGIPPGVHHTTRPCPSPIGFGLSIHQRLGRGPVQLGRTRRAYHLCPQGWDGPEFRGADGDGQCEYPRSVLRLQLSSFP